MPLTLYPEDLTASLPGNYIVGETRTFTTADTRIFVPNGAPFFVVDLELRDATTNQLLTPGVDYFAMQPDKDAMLAAVKSVMTVIWVTKTTVNSVRMKYRAIGGQYQNMAAILVDFLANVPVGALGAPTWGTILNKPATFPPSAHTHLPNEWNGYTEVIILLEQIRVTLVSGDRPTLAAVYQYIGDNLAAAVTEYLGTIDLQQPVVHNPATSGLLGGGVDGDPLSVNVDALDERFLTIEDANQFYTTRDAFDSHVETNAQQHQQLSDQIGSRLSPAQGDARYVGQTTYNGHVNQNSLEHGNLLALINNLAGRFQSMLEFEYAIGNYYWTSRRGNPNEWLEPVLGYETFWRPIIDRMLFAVDPVNGTPNQLLGRSSMLIGNEHIPPHSHVFPGDDNLALDANADPAGGTFGNDGAPLADGRMFPYDAASTPSPGTGRLLRTRETGGGIPINILNPVVTAFCWQRYDPNEARPLRTIAFSNEAPVDVNLLDRFTAIYGPPTLGERVQFIVDSGILITASTTLNYAIVTGDWPAGTDLELVIEDGAVVSGLGGKGGNGRAQYVYPASSSSGNDKNGENGGPGILATYPLRVLNYGILAGGGGGGGASSTWVATRDGVSYFVGNAGGGGGMPFGLGGDAGFVETGPNIVEWRTGEAGYPATLFNVGTGAVLTLFRQDELVDLTQQGGNGAYFGGVGIMGSGGANTYGAYEVAEYRPNGIGGLPGIATTGPVTVIGAPALGS